MSNHVVIEGWRPATVADLRAEAIFATASREAHAYIAEHGVSPDSQSALEARQGFEIGTLQKVIRGLCAEAEANAATIRRQEERIQQLQFDAYKGDEDDGDRSGQRFTANDAARAAVWGDV